jgi:hypothetical protein
MVITGQNAPAKIAVRPSKRVSATMNAASLTGVIERRASVAADMTVILTASVTVGVTDVITMIYSALRQM